MGAILLITVAIFYQLKLKITVKKIQNTKENKVNSLSAENISNFTTTTKAINNTPEHVLECKPES
jgi:hypothetical protein